MTIHLYLKDGDEEFEITTFYDVVSNPFKVGDVIRLRVEELYPKDLMEYNTDFQDKMRASEKEIEERFRGKSVKIISEMKYMTLKIMKKTQLNIDYHCEFVNE
jgi:hypothetical protein